jgi:hypothetical protein
MQRRSNKMLTVKVMPCNAQKMLIIHGLTIRMRLNQKMQKDLTAQHFNWCVAQHKQRFVNKERTTLKQKNVSVGIISQECQLVKRMNSNAVLNQLNQILRLKMRNQLNQLNQILRLEMRMRMRTRMRRKLNQKMHQDMTAQHVN